MRRQWLWGVVSGVLLVSGCHHRKPQPVLLPAQTPVPLETPPGEAKPALVEPAKPKLPPVPVAQQAEQPKKTRRRNRNAPKESAAATTAVAPTATTKSAETEAAAPISLGSLSVGGEQSPRVRQEAVELLAANERRLNGLTAELQKQVALVNKARQFQKDAQQALASGDAAGAKTLATKGKLLLDDLDAGATTK